MLFILSSCVSVGVIPLSKKMIKSAEKCELKLYWTKGDIAEGFEKLCSITSVVPMYPWSDHILDSALDYAHPQACKCGAQGAYIQQLDHKTLKLVAFKFKSNTPKSTPVSISKFKERLVCFEKKGTWKNQHCEDTEDLSDSNNPRKRY